MIHEKTPITLADVKEIADKLEEHEELKKYLKKFTKLKKEKADEMKKEVEALGNIKIKAEHVVKLIDFLPTQAEEVKKIFTDASLSDDEVNAIIDVVKKYAK